MAGSKIPTGHFANLPRIRKNLKLAYLPAIEPLPSTNSGRSFFGKVIQLSTKDAYFSKPAFLLAGELFTYLHENYEKLVKEFPVSKENLSELMPNLMGLHIVMAIERMLDEKTTESRKEIGTFFYYCQTYHFIPFARLCNDHLEPEDFASFYIESYSNRVDLILQKIMEIAGEVESEDKMRRLRKMMRSYVFLNLVKDEHPILEKLLKYYLAHRYYLSSLKYEDLLDYQVYWGLIAAPIQLQHSIREQD